MLVIVCMLAFAAEPRRGEGYNVLQTPPLIPTVRASDRLPTELGLSPIIAFQNMNLGSI